MEVCAALQLGTDPSLPVFNYTIARVLLVGVFPRCCGCGTQPQSRPQAAAGIRGLTSVFCSSLSSLLPPPLRRLSSCLLLLFSSFSPDAFLSWPVLLLKFSTVHVSPPLEAGAEPLRGLEACVPAPLPLPHSEGARRTYLPKKVEQEGGIDAPRSSTASRKKLSAVTTWLLGSVDATCCA